MELDVVPSQLLYRSHAPRQVVFHLSAVKAQTRKRHVLQILKIRIYPGTRFLKRKVSRMILNVRGFPFWGFHSAFRGIVDNER